MERFEITLEGLRELSQRIHRKELEPEDSPFLQALVLKQIARGENRQERILEKIEATKAAAGEDGTEHVHEGLGSDYIRYGWPACAMQMVMHDFSGAPFKRLESLHEGWDVPHRRHLLDGDRPEEGDQSRGRGPEASR